MSSATRFGDPLRARIEKINRRLVRLQRLGAVLSYAPKTLVFGLFIAWSVASRGGAEEDAISIGDWLLKFFGLPDPAQEGLASWSAWLGPAVLVAMVLYFASALWVFLGERQCFGALSQVTHELFSSPDVRWVPKIALHLRSFQDDRKLSANSRKTFVQGVLATKVPFVPRADGVLRRMIRSALPDTIVLRIGDKRLFPLAGEPIRVTDEGWWQLFQRLSRHSAAIVMSPLTDHHGGTYNELEQILATPRRYKTVFLVPARSAHSHGLVVRFFSGALSALLLVLTFGRVRVRGASGSERWEATRELLPDQLRTRLPKYPGGAGVFLPTRSGHVYTPGLSGRTWDHPISLRSICRGQWFGRPVWREAISTTLHLSAALGLAVLFFGAGGQLVVSQLLPLLRSWGSAVDIGGQVFSAAVILALGCFASNYYVQFCRRQGLLAPGKWFLGAMPLLVWGGAWGMDATETIPSGLAGQFWQSIDPSAYWMVFLGATHVLCFGVIILSRPDKGNAAT